MYLSIGKTTVIPENSIIGIFDLDTTTQSYLTREFLAAAEKNGKVINAAEDIPNSYVLCGEDDSQIFLSQSTSKTLWKRVNQLHEERRTTWRKSMN